MTDMNIDWARELLREAAGIYLAHLMPDDPAVLDDALIDVFVDGGLVAILRARAAGDSELEAQWPALPDLDGDDVFPNYPITGF